MYQLLIIIRYSGESVTSSIAQFPTREAASTAGVRAMEQASRHIQIEVIRLY